MGVAPPWQAGAPPCKALRIQSLTGLGAARSACPATPTRCRVARLAPNEWYGRATGRIRQRRKSRTMRSSSTRWRNGRETRRRARRPSCRTPATLYGFPRSTSWDALSRARSFYPLANDRWGSMLLKKDYEGGLLATLIQDQEQMRNHDLRNHLPGFVRFNLLIPQFLCGDFFNSIGQTRP